MNDKKHIDRLFQEKFKNFEPTPDDAVWDNIHNALHKDKSKRRVIPVWWFAAGVAALLVLLLTVGNVFNTGNGLNTPENTVVDTDANSDTSESNSTPIVNENNDNSRETPLKTEHKYENNNSNTTIVNNEPPEDAADSNSKDDKVEKIVNNQEKTATQIANEGSLRENTTNKTNSQQEGSASQKDKTVISNSKKEALAKNTSSQPQLNSNREVIGQDIESAQTILENDKEQSKIAQATDQNTLKDSETLKENKDIDIIVSNKKDESIEDAIAKANPTNEEEKEEQPNRWNISPNVAPVYFNSLGKGSSIDNQFVNNGKSGDVNMSYGISGSYAINDKIKIRAGVNKVDLGYSTDGVIAFRDVNSFNTNADGAELKNINFTSQRKSDAYMSTSNINTGSAPQFVLSDSKGSLEQQFGYIEVPLELEYSIINSRFGMNVIGGFSTLFLNNNKVYSVLENERSLLGDANNINSTSYSANFGLGFDYNISHTLKLNLEPMFKYQINTFTNTSGDFRPYFIGVYTGFSFKF